MKWDEIDHSVCSVARAMSVIGDRWTILILREAFIGTRRFDEFQLYLTAAPHIISMRLKKLVEYGLLEKQKYQDRPTRYEYRLTDSGRELYPSIVMLAQWGYKWLGDDKGPAINRVHKSCGHRLTMVPACAQCGEVVNLHDVKAELSPRFAAERRRTVELHNKAVENSRKPAPALKSAGAGKRKS
jgi:DNA-binding HxlR family transcriptional regulator